MCRNIRVLFNFAPPTTEEEIRAAALQYVRKVSGSSKPSGQNSEAFARGVEQITAATHELLAALVTTQPPKSREEEARKGRERFEKRRQRFAGSGGTTP